MADNHINKKIWELDNTYLDVTSLDPFLMWCSDQNASRIEMQTDRHIMIRAYGVNYIASEQKLQKDDIFNIISRFYKSDGGVIQLSNGFAIDVSYVIWGGKGKRYSYRVNVIQSFTGSEIGASITIRPLVDIPTPLEQQRVEPRLLDALEGSTGMFLICGATGSGKTTLIGGINRQRLEDCKLNCDIIEGSAPLELLYDLVEVCNSTVTQVEIPRDLKNFSDFIRASMRREPTDIIVGECRDPETMNAAIQAAISGHRLTTSIHTSNCVSTVRRVSALCPPDQRDSLTISFAENIKLIVNQRLLPSLDGKRIAIREFLPFNNKIRNSLLDSQHNEWPRLTREALMNYGQTFEQSIKCALQEKLISEEVAEQALIEER